MEDTSVACAIDSAVNTPAATNAAVPANTVFNKPVVNRIVDGGQVNIVFTSDAKSLMRVLSANLPAALVIVDPVSL